VLGEDFKTWLYLPIYLLVMRLLFRIMVHDVFYMLVNAQARFEEGLRPFFIASGSQRYRSAPDKI